MPACPRSAARRSAVTPSAWRRLMHVRSATTQCVRSCMVAVWSAADIHRIDVGAGSDERCYTEVVTSYCSRVVRGPPGAVSGGWIEGEWARDGWRYHNHRAEERRIVSHTRWISWYVSVQRKSSKVLKPAPKAIRC